MLFGGDVTALSRRAEDLREGFRVGAFQINRNAGVRGVGVKPFCLSSHVCTLVRPESVHEKKQQECTL